MIRVEIVVENKEMQFPLNQLCLHFVECDSLLSPVSVRARPIGRGARAAGNAV